MKNIFSKLVLILVVCVAGFSFYAFTRYTVPILMYHRIDKRGEVSSLSVSPSNFEKQMAFLAKHKYNVISLDEFAKAKKQGSCLPRNTVVITFDDGYEDNYKIAFPILKKHNIPAIIFVIVDVIGSEGYLSYSQIAEMVSSGIITIGSHSLSGGYLPGRPEAVLKHEIGSSKIKLERNIGKAVDFFCYPIGGFTKEIQGIVKQAGYKAACSTNRGLIKNNLNEDLYALKRIKITDSDPNIFVFWAKISGYYNLFRSVKNPHSELKSGN
ncbi:MAG: polysaccharide deacetylase family protein [Candidatus Omnitrophica bacterium]|nr:polysaccharide deacetylase family protein [Candidatus Omnitrophota bacterium]